MLPSIMATAIFPLTLRLLVVVLLASFLSPAFAWQKLASHSALAHADAVVVADEAHHDHDHDGAGYGHDHDDAAHGHIGHLLSHLPVMTADIAPLLPAPAHTVFYPARRCSVTHADPEPPYKPPRNVLFA